VPYAHWITAGRHAKKRFDTWFFLAAATAGAGRAPHDGKESTDFDLGVRRARRWKGGETGRLQAAVPRTHGRNLIKLGKQGQA